MILFYQDWDNYPGAIVDTKTNNHSFIRMAAMYRDMGIKNHSFILSLLNPSLQGVDPFSKNLSIEEMAMIVVECKQNFWYFIREIAKDPGVASATTSQFKANRGNIALYWLFYNHIQTTLIQIRQTGKSFAMSVLMSYLLNIRCLNTQINLVTKDDYLRSQSLSKLKDIDGEFPFYLKQRTKMDLSNTEELTVKSLGNSFKAHLPNKSPKMANMVGRGLVSPIFHFDEAAFLSNIEISLPAALAAGTAARDMAKRNNEPYGTILTTTVGRKDDRDGRYIYNLVSESAVWTENFLDTLNLEDLEKTVRRNSPTGKPRMNCTFNHRQLGYSDAWLKKTIEDNNAVGEAAAQDFMNVWGSGSQSSPLPADLTNRIRASESKEFNPIISSPYGYITRWYLNNQQIEYTKLNNHLIIGVDSSDAVGGDDIAIIIRECKTGAVVGAGTYNETNLITFAEWLCKWFIDFPQMTMIIERRSTGAMILDYLLLMLPPKGIDPFKRIYNQIASNPNEHVNAYQDINRPIYSRTNDVYIRYKKYFGFATSAHGATSRSELYSKTLLAAAKYTGDFVNDSKLINQLLGLIIKNGRVDHADGEKDDHCIAWILTYWILTQTENLDYYGINSRLVLSNNKILNVQTNPVEVINNQEQVYYRDEIERIVNQIHSERDQFIIIKLEMQLRSLANRLKLSDNEVFSVDDLIKSLREHKKMQRVINQR